MPQWQFFAVAAVPVAVIAAAATPLLTKLVLLIDSLALVVPSNVFRTIALNYFVPLKGLAMLLQASSKLPGAQTTKAPLLCHS